MKKIEFTAYQLTTEDEIKRLKNKDLSVLPDLNLTNEEYNLLKYNIRLRMIFRRDQVGRLKFEKIDDNGEPIYESTILKIDGTYYCITQNFKT